MTKDELKGVIKSNVYAWHNYDAILAAVEKYSSALIAAKPNVSGSFCDCKGNETQKYYDDNGVKRCWECRKEAK